MERQPRTLDLFDTVSTKMPAPSSEEPERSSHKHGRSQRFENILIKKHFSENLRTYHACEKIFQAPQRMEQAS
jgi:hypothetical protein